MPKPILAIRTYPRIFALAIFLFLSSLVVTAGSLGKTTTGGDDGSGIGGTGRVGGSGLGGTGAPFLGVKNDVENESNKFDNELPETNEPGTPRQESIEAFTRPAIEIELARTSDVDSRDNNPATEINLPALDLPKLLTRSMEENSLNPISIIPTSDSNNPGKDEALNKAGLDLLDESSRVELDLAQVEKELDIPAIPALLDDEIISGREGPVDNEPVARSETPPPVIRTMAEALYALATANKTKQSTNEPQNFDDLLTTSRQQLVESIPVNLSEELPDADGNERPVKAPGFFRRPEIPRVQRILPVQRIILPPRVKPMRI